MGFYWCIFHYNPHPFGGTPICSTHPPFCCRDYGNMGSEPGHQAKQILGDWNTMIHSGSAWNEQVQNNRSGVDTVDTRDFRTSKVYPQSIQAFGGCGGCQIWLPMANGQQKHVEWCTIASPTKGLPKGLVQWQIDPESPDPIPPLKPWSGAALVPWSWRGSDFGPVLPQSSNVAWSLLQNWVPSSNVAGKSPLSSMHFPSKIYEACSMTSEGNVGKTIMIIPIPP